MSEASPFKHASADDSAGFLLWKLTALWQQQLIRVLESYDITHTQFVLLASLRWFEESAEPPTQAHLANHTKIDKMTLSKALRKLETQGLVKRSASREDSRAVNVRFTAKGRSVVHQAVLAIEAADDRFFAGLDVKELATYKALTAALVRRNDL